MPLVRINRDQNFKQVFIAADAIADLCTIELVAAGAKQVTVGSTANQHLAAGVARGTVTSGKLVHVITHGFVSGPKCAAAVQAGDRLAIANSGYVTPFNSITPAGYPVVSGALLMSGYFASGFLSGALSGYGYPTSGFVRANISGTFTGTAFNTGRVLGRALTSGAINSSVQMIVTLE